MAKKYREEFFVSPRDGTKQFLLHIDAGPDAPVLLLVHGGPGSPETVLGNRIKKWWGDLFTLVFWEQRGSGRTLKANGKHGGPVTMEDLQNDMADIVEHLKQYYGKKKIGIFGHSWGTVLTHLYTLEHPENVLELINVGVCVAVRQNEMASYKMLERKISEAGNEGDLAKLRALHGVWDKIAVGVMTEDKDVRVFSGLRVKYRIVMRLNWRVIRYFFCTPLFRPCYLAVYTKEAQRINGELRKFLLNFDLAFHGYDYQAPVVYILGEDDGQTVTSLGVEFFERLRAPAKLLRVIPGAGHDTICDQSAAFARAMSEARALISSISSKEMI
jgi:pimeloyl-ACP methyl ester carboxylesterase